MNKVYWIKQKNKNNKDQNEKCKVQVYERKNNHKLTI